MQRLLINLVRLAEPVSARNHGRLGSLMLVIIGTESSLVEQDELVEGAAGCPFSGLAAASGEKEVVLLLHHVVAKITAGLF